MSNQQLPVIKHLREGLQKEALQTGKKLRKSGGQQSHSQLKKQLWELTEPHQQKLEPKVVIDQAKILSKKPSIFAARSENQNIENIFANKKSVNLFNIYPKSQNQQGINIFKLAASSQPVIKDQLDDILSQSSQGPEGDEIEQNMKQPEQKVMKYSYQQKMEKLGDFRVIKFKSGADVTKQGIMLLSVEKQKQGRKSLVYLILRTQATKITISQSILLQNTKTEHFMNKQQNIKFWASKLKKKEQNLNAERQIVKIQFENVKQAKRFEQLIEATLAKTEI